MEERLVDVFWEGPIDWHDRAKLDDPKLVLYSIHGSHHLYGSDVLLYLGMTETTVSDRLGQHRWVLEESESARIRVASLRAYRTWDEWDKEWEKLKDGDRYPKPDARLVRGVEALMIHAHQPAYNTCDKSTLSDSAHGLRVFNTGHKGLLLPELSYGYYRP